MKRSVTGDSRILILAIGIVAVFTRSALALNLEEYYPLAQGNSWKYSVTEESESYEETIKIEGKEMIDGVKSIKILYTDNEYDCVAIDFEGVKEYKTFDDNEYEIFNPPMIIFPNIEKGERRSYSVNSITYSIKGEKVGETSWSNQIALEAVEDVKVSAGRFTDCLRFSLISERKEPDGSYERDDYTTWLAPGVGKVKETCFGIEYNAETKETQTGFGEYELASAVIDGRKIGGQ